MKLSTLNAALFAACAEAMFAPGVATPELDERMAGWRITGYITAQNALFGLQRMGLGDRVYYGFVAQNNADPADYVAVFRGTEVPLEWLSDFRFLPRYTPAGAVVRGFWEIYETAWFGRLSDGTADYAPDVAALSIADVIPAGSTVTVIGHSLGAALATFLTRDLALASHGRFKVQGQFFASPKPGDNFYATSFDKAVGVANYQAINYERDFVPHAPPIGYVALTNTHWLKFGAVDLPDDAVANHNVLNYAARLRAIPAVGEPA